ncbi:hypothetical protein LX32DRAFT_167588 [Colletotrichum zoysiae]|uniref:Uncharacterized protein n=1 Tax=Colletotrichum zoysiae TaxID=1216348 RepID=A0AAD9HRL3_9PEZI|nr:hypothetical protein LX32DRAFT_167588 [Colletotrichum zoysiae]
MTVLPTAFIVHDSAMLFGLCLPFLFQLSQCMVLCLLRWRSLRTTCSLPRRCRGPIVRTAPKPTPRPSCSTIAALARFTSGKPAQTQSCELETSDWASRKAVAKNIVARPTVLDLPSPWAVIHAVILSARVFLPLRE